MPAQLYKFKLNAEGKASGEMDIDVFTMISEADATTRLACIEQAVCATRPGDMQDFTEKAFIAIETWGYAGDERTPNAHELMTALRLAVSLIPDESLRHFDPKTTSDIAWLIGHLKGFARKEAA